VVRDGDSRTTLVVTMARLLREQGFAATGLAQVLAESGVSNGSLYHHFPGGLEELAEFALIESGQAVAAALSQALGSASCAQAGIAMFLDVAARPDVDGSCPGCPIAPTALEAPIISPRLRAAATRCFENWQGLIAARLRTDGWPEETVMETASAALALIEGALLLARVSGDSSHLTSAKRATASLLAVPAAAANE
jgi:TetR/AcrR family transcriptional regulator, lmrAB and yxaGH operons repressor